LTRKVIGILVGVALCLLAAMFLKWLLADYAFAPAGLDPSDPDQAGQIMARMPMLGLLGTLAAYFISSLSGSFIGSKIAHARWAAWTIGGLFAAVTLLGQVMSRFPIWLVLATLAVAAVAAWLASLWAGDPEPDEAETSPAPAPWSAAPEPAYRPDEPRAAWEPQPDADDGLFDPEPEAEPEPVITRPRYASFEELRAAAPRRDGDKAED
jgi:hypothetical protein